MEERPEGIDADSPVYSFDTGAIYHAGSDDDVFQSSPGPILHDQFILPDFRVEVGITFNTGCFSIGHVSSNRAPGFSSLLE